MSAVQQPQPVRSVVRSSPPAYRREIAFKQATRHLKVLDPEAESWTFQTFDDNADRKDRNLARVLNGTLAEHYETLKALQKRGAGVFVTVNVTDGKGRRLANITAIRAIWKEDDDNKPDALSLPVEPHLIIKSSKGKKFHHYILVEGAPVDEFDGVQARLVNDYGSDPAAADKARVLRLAGFYHQKVSKKKGLTGKKFRVEIIHESGAPPMQWGKVKEKIPPDEVKSRTKPTTGDPGTNPVLAALMEKKLYIGTTKKEGAHDIICPWADDHSGDDKAAYFEPNHGGYAGHGFKCMHGHSQAKNPDDRRERTIADLLKYLGVRKDDRPVPQPLRRKLPPAEPYPIEALGDVLAPMARKISEIIQSPEAIAGQSLAASATLAVQGHADVIIDGRVFPISENFVAVAESGERKSATDRAALAPHHKRQKDLRADLGDERATYEADLAAWKKARDEALSSKTNKGREAKREALLAIGPEPEAPIDPIMMTEEPTYEGLVKALAYGWPSMGIYSDEGGRFLGGHGMNSDNQLKTATGLSKLWDGDPITRTRGGDGNMLLYGRRLSVHLMIQPEISNALFGNQLLIGQGLMSRCLVCYPASNIGNRPYKEADLSGTPEMGRYFGRMMSLLEAPLPLAGDSQNQLEPRQLPLNPAAKNTWIGFHDHIEKLCRDGEPLHPIKGFAAKAAEHAARLAGTLALVEDLHISTIHPSHIEAGIELAQFYLGEALRLFNSAAENPDLVLAEKLLLWAKDKGHTLISLPLVYQAGPNGIRDKATAKRIVQILEGHDWMIPIEGGAEVAGKHRRDVWEVNA